MNISELDTFVRVAESGSISAASEQLYVSQPAVSRRIQALEQRLNTALFDRLGKRLQLNAAGRALLPQAQQIMATWQDTQRQLETLSDQVSGELHLATSHHIGLHRLAPVLREFRQRYPEVQLNIQFEDSEVAHELVRESRIELAIATLPPEQPADLYSEIIWHDPLIFVGAQAYQANLAELAAQPCVLPGPSTYTGRMVVSLFADQGLTLRPAMATNYLETIHMLVGVGLGWSMLPATMQQTLARLEVDAPPLQRELGLVFHPQRVMSNAASAFIDVLRDSR